ncbi:YaaA family protein [Georgenia alba]|uniref:YaaA family protein n=1 Tax=Georgenia alba TaxID=2233858 RepID=A0ABW2Q972_9MICO
MLLLLPPSEGKTAPAHGRPVDLAELSAPGLAGARDRVLDHLIDSSARPDATGILGVGAGLAEEVRANTALRTAPAGPAATVYTGVLFAAARLGHLTGTARRRATASVRIFSGLWGVLAPGDRIPAYRLSMDVTLPGLEPRRKLSAYWREHLPEVLDEQAVGDVVVDCRSATYAASWRPPAGSDHVDVRVVREHDGRRQVVSHNAKHARGLLVHHLLTRPGRPLRSAQDVAAAAEEMVTRDEPAQGENTGQVDAVELDHRPRGWTLTLVSRRA